MRRAAAVGRRRRFAVVAAGLVLAERRRPLVEVDLEPVELLLGGRQSVPPACVRTTRQQAAQHRDPPW